jgi:hypothetical protein
VPAATEFSRAYSHLANAEGRIRYDHFGEGDYDEGEWMIQHLLREATGEGIDNELVSVAPDGFEAQAGERWSSRGSITSCASPGRSRTARSRSHSSIRASRRRSSPSASDRLGLQRCRYTCLWVAVLATRGAFLEAARRLQSEYAKQLAVG